MDEAEKKRIAEFNAAAEAGADNLLGRVAASSYSWVIVIAALVAAFLLGVWAVK